MDSFDWLLDVSESQGFDLRTPGHLLALWDTISEELHLDGMELEETHYLLVLYVRYRVEQGLDAGAWLEVQAEIEQAALQNPILTVIGWAIDQIYDDATHTALEGIPAYNNLRELLGWIGSGRQVTGTGDLRRADIAYAASLLGISALGVNKLPPPAAGNTTQHVLSMREIPMLARWWDAIMVAGLIEVRGQKVYPGHSAEGFWQDPRQASFVTVFAMAAGILLPHPDDTLNSKDASQAWVFEVLAAAIARAMDGPDGELAENFASRPLTAYLLKLVGDSDWETMAGRLAEIYLGQLAELGLIEQIGTHWEIRPNLAAPVGAALDLCLPKLPDWNWEA